jgi:aerobic-type carbon monoxide dehydrogenase small subunit (CoxS/CutS family)
MPEAAEIIVNGQKHTVDAPAETSLLEVLRNDLALTGTKYGCGEGMCGACTVLVGGQAVRSCITPLGAAIGQKVETVEGLEIECCPDAIQQAFIDECAMQCGYCVPGMIMSAHALLRETPDPTDAQIIEHMDGNVCRCGGYPKMLAAIKRAAASMRGEK